MNEKVALPSQQDSGTLAAQLAMHEAIEKAPEHEMHVINGRRIDTWLDTHSGMFVSRFPSRLSSGPTREIAIESLLSALKREAEYTVALPSSPAPTQVNQNNQREGETLATWIKRCGMESVERALRKERQRYNVAESVPSTPSPTNPRQHIYDDCGTNACPACREVMVRVMMDCTRPAGAATETPQKEAQQIADDFGVPVTFWAGPEKPIGKYGVPSTPVETQIIGMDLARGKDITGYHCTACGDSAEPCAHFRSMMTLKEVREMATPVETASPDLYFDFKGWRFRAPFLCMNCGREISARQWGFCRGCGICDVGKGPQSMGWFAGPHELIDPNADYFLKPERFVDAKDGPLPYPKPRIPPRPRPPLPRKPPTPRRPR